MCSQQGDVGTEWKPLALKLGNRATPSQVQCFETIYFCFFFFLFQNPPPLGDRGERRGRKGGEGKARVRRLKKAEGKQAES